jgi:hypothetical protein
MRTIVIAAAVAGFALASCTSKHTTIEQPTAAPAPVVVAPAAPVIVQPTAGRPATIAYTVNGQQQLDQASVMAANWCRANYGTDARLVDRARSSAGDLVTYACVSG